MSDDPIELLRQLRERDRAEHTRREANVHRAAAAEVDRATQAADELAVLVGLLKKESCPTEPLYRFKKTRQGWNSQYDVFKRVDSAWHITSIRGAEGAADRHWVLTEQGVLFGEVEAVPRRDDQKFPTVRDIN